jgi:hypothetical protein
MIFNPDFGQKVEVNYNAERQPDGSEKPRCKRACSEQLELILNNGLQMTAPIFFNLSAL